MTDNNEPTHWTHDTPDGQWYAVKKRVQFDSGDKSNFVAEARTEELADEIVRLRRRLAQVEKEQGRVTRQRPSAKTGITMSGDERDEREAPQTLTVGAALAELRKMGVMRSRIEYVQVFDTDFPPSARITISVWRREQSGKVISATTVDDAMAQVRKWRLNAND